MIRRIIHLHLILFVTIAMCISCGSKEETVIKPDLPLIIETPIDPDFPTNPQDIDTEGKVLIIFGTLSAAVTNPFENKGVTISTHEANVVIQSTATETITYILTGSTPDGSLKIYSDTQFDLLMNGVDVTNSNDPALNIQSHKKASVELIEGTSNRLAGGMGFISEDGSEKVKAAFFSRGQIVLSGEGSLWVYSRYRHAICSDDYIRINSGVITIPLSANDGIHANDYIEINDGTIDINSMGDGLDSEGYVLITGGSIHITTTEDKSHGIKSATETTVQSSGEIIINVEGDASKAFKSKGDMLVSKGKLQLTATGDACYDAEEEDTSSASGIKCNSNLTIYGGHIVINSSGVGGKGLSIDGTLTIHDGELDVTTTGAEYKISGDNTKAKALKIDGSISIHGGLVYANSKTDHAVSTKSSLLITDGTIIGVGNAQSKKGFDFSETFKITGGTIIGIGEASSVPTANACTQHVINYSGEVMQNRFFAITSSGGNNILTYQLPYTLSKAFILFGSPDIEQGTNYTILSGGAVTGGSTFNGLYSGATYSGGTSLLTFSISSMVTSVN